MGKEGFLSETWLNGSYSVNGYKVAIDTSLSYVCIENVNDENEYYVFQGDEGDRTIEEINYLYNTQGGTVGEAVSKWVNLNL